MSFWTHVNGMIEVSPLGRTQHEKRYILETALDHLPLVTGSEGNMNVHIVQKSGTNVSKSCNEFGEHSDSNRDARISYYQKRRPSIWYDVQTSYYLVVEGDFRDRVYRQTYLEFQKWLCRLAKRVSVDSVLVKISGEDIRKGSWYSSVIRNAGPYMKMCEMPSWCKENGEPNWCEYLMWESNPWNDYPLKLIHKLSTDPDVNDEMKRRREFEGRFTLV